MPYAQTTRKSSTKLHKQNLVGARPGIRYMKTTASGLVQVVWLPWDTREWVRGFASMCVQTM
jgi:hypothetical protein